MESSKCESADNTGTEQLATAHCTCAQQCGGGSTPATAKADRLAADCLQKKRHRVKETTEEHVARLYSYLIAGNFDGVLKICHLAECTVAVERS